VSAVNRKPEVWQTQNQNRMAQRAERIAAKAKNSDVKEHPQLNKPKKPDEPNELI
jgi:hypothetical protein